jgi:hypothetical protein
LLFLLLGLLFLFLFVDLVDYVFNGKSGDFDIFRGVLVIGLDVEDLPPAGDACLKVFQCFLQA